MKDELTAMPNVGAVMARELREIGVRTHGDLARLGSVEAAFRIAWAGRKKCRSMLCALEGAIRGVRWHSIPKEERDNLWAAFQAKRGGV